MIVPNVGDDEVDLVKAEERELMRIDDEEELVVAVDPKVDARLVICGSMML